MADIDDVQDTAVFIKKIVTSWNSIKAKGLGDPSGVIKDPQDTRLDYLLDMPGDDG